MKATGIVRKIDELGRIVIPMELRRTLEISEKDPLEIFVDGDKIILRKYSPGCNFCGSQTVHRRIGEKHLCRECVRSLQQGIGS
ncbi:AbrB/MazE/SpoVT family DNA-binding domain-containing protein [Paenibacillus sp. P22]|uniref:AbrB/MazE/SpoVT family DNA-binding domain-containing protein n=1 Tax=Paenibacillus sp. P22 TaxID=483908 RepID=UPI0006610B7E|nr:AbrB/MazE/SpoVT family DNA-binding domain-containing protein [Paenibacillus sp. P22]